MSEAHQHQNPQSTHFDEIAHVYDESLPAHVVEHYLRKRVALMTSMRPAGRGLDVGCGTGVLAERLARAGLQMTGIDPSEGMLEVAREHAPSVATVHGSGTDLPFPDGSFDLVVTVATMHHIAAPDDVRATLSEMVRVLAPGGRLVYWDHSPLNPYWRFLMARVPQDTGEERLIPEPEVLAGLGAAGATILSSRQLGFVPDFTPVRALRAAAALERALERTPGIKRWGAHNVVIATKSEA